jgi:hypothetical protein
MLLWPTGGTMINATVIGLFPQLRYVVFTEDLIKHFPDDETVAVLGHEAGHVYHGHQWKYLLFLVLSLTASVSVTISVQLLLESIVSNTTSGKLLAMASTMVEQSLSPGTVDAVAMLASVTVMGLYLFIVFGWLSRLCERQADLFGARAVSCLTPQCEGHTSETVLAARGSSLCRAGLCTMARALERVLIMNSQELTSSQQQSRWQRLLNVMRSWQHGTIESRVAFLHSAVVNPALAESHERKTRRGYLVLCLILLVLTLLAVPFAGEQLPTYLSQLL